MLDVQAGGETFALPTAARTPHRPVVVRILQRDGETCCQAGPRPPVAAPALHRTFGYDAVAADPSIAVEIIAAGSNRLPVLPRGFAGARRAGAVDHVSLGRGITGWIADRDHAAPHAIELRCGDVVLARTVADRPRARDAPHVAEAPLGRFSMPWITIDRRRLADCAATTPDAALEMIVPALGARLDDAYRPLSARSAHALAGPALSIAPAPPAPRTTPSRTISAVVLSHDYARYLPARLGTLLGQDIELILLDDASTDASIATALDLAARARREIQIVASRTNSGAVLPQWRRAAQLARGDYLLLAEADDVADPALIPRLAAVLDAHPDMAFAFADSAQVDTAGAITRADHKDYYAALGDRLLDRAGVMPADQFLLRCLMPRNLVVNVSAVLWRTASLRAAFARIGDAIHDFRAAGDWRVYIEACRGGGTIGYVADVLNQFRRHAGSVIGRQSHDRHLAEVAAIHAHLLTLVGGDPATAARLADHRATLVRLWSVDAPGVTS